MGNCQKCLGPELLQWPKALPGLFWEMDQRPTINGRDLQHPLLWQGAGVGTQKRVTPTVHPVNRMRGVLQKRFPGYNAPPFPLDGNWTDIPSHHHSPVPPAFALKPINEAKLASLLKRYKGGKALPSDHLCGNLLKVSSKVGLSALVHIVNLSIKESSFCHHWKHQLVVVHHKKGESLLDIYFSLFVFLKVLESKLKNKYVPSTHSFVMYIEIQLAQ